VVTKVMPFMLLDSRQQDKKKERGKGTFYSRTCTKREEPWHKQKNPFLHAY